MWWLLMTLKDWNRKIVDKNITYIHKAQPKKFIVLRIKDAWGYSFYYNGKQGATPYGWKSQAEAEERLRSLLRDRKD